MKIWKFPAPITDVLPVLMPAGAQLLTVQLQHDEPHVWALVDPAAPIMSRQFRWIGTGHPIEGEVGQYVGTVQMAHGSLIFHLFVLPDPSP